MMGFILLVIFGCFSNCDRFYGSCQCGHIVANGSFEIFEILPVTESGQVNSTESHRPRNELFAIPFNVAAVFRQQLV